MRTQIYADNSMAVIARHIHCVQCKLRRSPEGVPLGQSL